MCDLQLDRRPEAQCEYYVAIRQNTLVYKQSSNKMQFLIRNHGNCDISYVAYVYTARAFQMSQ